MTQTKSGIYIQYFSSGTASGWFSRLHESYKKDWSSSVTAFEKHFFSQETAYYSQVEAYALTKKETESVRQYAFKVQQLVEKCCYNEYAETTNLRCIESSTQRLPKN